MGNKRKISHEHIYKLAKGIHTNHRSESSQSQGKRLLWGEENSFRLLRADSALAFVEHTSLPLGARCGLLPGRLRLSLCASQRNTLLGRSWLPIWACFWSRLCPFKVAVSLMHPLILKTGQNLFHIQRSTQGREGPICAKRALKSGEPPWAEKVVVNSRLQLAENCFDQLGGTECCWTCSRSFLAEDFTRVLQVKNICEVWSGSEKWNWKCKWNYSVVFHSLRLHGL